MKKVMLGNTGLEVTEIGLGVLTIGENQLNLSLKDGADIVKYAYDKGIRFFDTAQLYGTYPNIAEAFKDMDLSENNPERPVIASKSLEHSYDGMRAAVMEFLDTIGLEKADIFMLHEVWEDPDWEYRDSAWQCLIDMKNEGLIKAIGVSTHHVDVVERMANVPECDVVFPLINYAGLGIRKGSEAGSAEEMSAAIKRCMDAGKGVFAMKSFGGGNLTGTYMKALNYVKDIGMHSIMVGCGKYKEVDDIVDYAEGRLPADYQPEVSYKKIRVNHDCVGCGNCVKRCNSKAITLNEEGTAVIDYDKCVTCGYCAPVCPMRALIMW